MIFYFTGTGNSLQAARSLGAYLGESLVDISKAAAKKEYTYEIEPGETVGFVFPVYYWGLPSIVAHFVRHLVLWGNEEKYIWAVLTCGGSMGGADRRLKKQVERIGCELSAVWEVQMPDNYLPMYDVESEEKQKEKLEKAEEKFKEIAEAIENRTEKAFSNPAASVKTATMYPLYRNGRKTEKFYATDSCVNCGRCEEICPVQAIKITDGRPKWVKEQCVHCMGCINRCPAEAIQYGKATLKRGRYENDALNRF